MRKMSHGTGRSAIFSRKTAIISVFIGFFMILAYPAFAQAGFLSNLLDFFGYSGKTSVEERAPVFINQSLASVVMPALDSALNPSSGTDDADFEEGISPTIIQDSALLAPLNPLGVVGDGYGGGQIFIYTVKQDDNLSVIAKSFGVSVNTIMWSNELTNAKIRPGDKLVILPISGVQVEVKKGDTIDSIAKTYKGNIADILSFNGLSTDEPLAVGSTLIIPDGELNWLPSYGSVSSRYSAEISRYPTYAGYYLRPIQGGRKSRGVHGYNGVDLADSCGLPVFASASGTVIISRSSGWNGGYGEYVVISHPNGTQTLYAHLSSVLALAGQVVEQGRVVGAIGSTGNSTGCHLHFEVRGAANPWAG